MGLRDKLDAMVMQTPDGSTLSHINSILTLIEALNEQDDRRLAQIKELQDDVRALSNRIEALTQATRHVQRLPSEQA